MAPVLLRLLIPFNPVDSRLSIQNLTQKTPVAETLTELSQLRAPIQSYDRAYAQAAAEYEAAGTPAAALDSSDLEALEYRAYEKMYAGPTLGQLLKYAWLITAMLAGLWILNRNLRFWRLLRRHRRSVVLPNVPIPVYVSDAVVTPCQFGLLKPAIYLTEEVFGDSQMLTHVITHELTHHRHRDHIWAALRCLCLAIHWFNPLVWLAAELSRRDCELACDEAAIRRLGEQQRMEYGRTLIGLTCNRRGATALYVTATTMVGRKRAIRERIVLIAKHPKTAAHTLIAVVLVAAIAAGCTFTGSVSITGSPAATEEESVSPTGYPSDQIQISLIFVNGQLYVWDSGTAERPTSLDSNYLCAGQILQQDNRQEPDRELTACHVDVGSEVFYDPADDLYIYYRFPDGTIFYPMIRADQVENWWCG